MCFFVFTVAVSTMHDPLPRWDIQEQFGCFATKEKCLKALDVADLRHDRSFWCRRKFEIWR